MVLWFVAEAEDVPIDLVKAYIKEVELMESALFKSIFAQGEARAEARMICKLLNRWLGSVDPAVREHIASIPDPDLLVKWSAAAIELRDIESARRLLDQILQTPVPSQTT